MDAGISAFLESAEVLGVESLKAFSESFCELSDTVCNELFKEAGIGLQARIQLLNLRVRLRNEALDVAEMSQLKPKWQTKLGRLLMLTPIINVFYDLLLPTMPSIDKLKEVLNIIGLLGALFLTIAMALPTAISSSDYDAVLAKFDSTGVYGDCSLDGKFLIEGFNHYVTMGTVFSIIPLISVLLIYVNIATMGDREYFTGALRGWWNWSRVPITMSGIFLIVAVTEVSNGFRFLLAILMPNPYLMENSCGSAENLGDIGWLSFSKDNTWGWTVSTFIFINGSYIVVFVFMSMALRARSKHFYFYPHLSLKITDGADVASAQHQMTDARKVFCPPECSGA